MAKKGIKSWSKADWFWAVISEAAFFVFLWVVQIVFAAPGDVLTGSLALWVLANLTLIACPVFRKHFL